VQRIILVDKKHLIHLYVRLAHLRLGQPARPKMCLFNFLLLLNKELSDLVHSEASGYIFGVVRLLG
jgi:hypothetical protein